MRDAGAEPISIHITRRAWTCPSCRCRAAPNDLKIAPRRMSVPIATVGLKPKTRIRIGVISDPPPIPVIPTRRPIRRPAIESFQSIVLGRGRCRHEQLLQRVAAETEAERLERDHLVRRDV